MARITFYAYGHHNIKATHRTTLEITKESYLTSRGDCIIAVKSQYACTDLPNDLKKRIRRKEAKILLILEIDGLKEVIEGYGDEKLLLTSSKSIVVRKSTYIDSRTLMIRANKSATDLDRKLVEKLKYSGTKLKITIDS